LVETLRLCVAVTASSVLGYVLVATKFVPKRVITETYLGPFTDFFRRYGKTALLILALISTYRIADVIMGVMANVFYVDLGFDKQEIGRISKGFGLIMTLFGGFLGGALAVRYGVMKILMLGAILAAVSNLLFALLASIGNDIMALIVVISADNLSAGIASAAFVAYLSGLTSTSFTASQYALFSSIMVLLPKILAGYSGVVVESVGYEIFFIGTAAMGIPVLVLIYLVAKQDKTA
jgi:PAT family beta-lactamase induction signal transducer AmpG